MEIPLTLGVVGVVLLPVFAAVGALAALVANCTLEIERVEKRADVLGTFGKRRSSYGPSEMDGGFLKESRMDSERSR